MRTTSYRARAMKLISATSTDLDRPTLTRHLLANVRSVVQVLPTDVPVVPLKDDGPTTTEFEVRTHDKQPVEVQQITCAASYAAATIEPTAGTEGGDHAYKVHLTVQKEAPIGRSVFIA